MLNNYIGMNDGGMAGTPVIAFVTIEIVGPLFSANGRRFNGEILGFLQWCWPEEISLAFRAEQWLSGPN